MTILNINKSGSLNKVYLLLQLVMLSILYICFELVPFGASPYIIWPCLLIFYTYFITSLMRPIHIVKGLPTIIKIDLLFMMFYFLLYYLPYQFWLLGFSELGNSVFVSDTYVRYSNKAVLASTAGIISFMIGYRNISIFQLVSVERSAPDKYVTHFVFIFLFVFLLLFFLTGFSRMFSGAYGGSDTGSNTENGIYFLVSHFVMIVFAVLIYFLSQKRKINNFLKISLAISILWCLLLLVLGDRNTFFILAIVFGGGYFTFVKKIKYIGLISAIFIAISTYNIIEISRNADERGIEAITNAITSTNENSHSITEGSFNNTTITSRAVFSLVPDKHDFFLGKIKIIGFAGIVPFSRSLFVDKSDRYTTSADIITEGVLGPDSTWSLGSNIISDIYVDFGFIGIFFLMLFMGGGAVFVQSKIIKNPNSMKWLVIYLIFLGLYAEAPRYSYDFAVRNIAWTILLFWGYEMFFKHKAK